MPEKTLIAGIRKESDSPILNVTSPVVGLSDRPPRPGNFLNPLDRILTLRVLNQRMVLRLPRDVSGRVVEVRVGNGLTPVAYNDVLLRLDPRVLEAGEGAAGAAAAGGLSGTSIAGGAGGTSILVGGLGGTSILAGATGATAGSGLPVAMGSSTTGEIIPPDVIVVTAPSEGMFYRRPSPDAPAYVEVGSKISAGAVLGLVEVMKCFNPIHFGGPGLPDHGEVTRVLVEDNREVEFGQALFWVVPVK